MENRESYTPQEVVRMIKSYWHIRRAFEGADNIRKSEEFQGAIETNPLAGNDLTAAIENIKLYFRERIPTNVVSALEREGFSF